MVRLDTRSVANPNILNTSGIGSHAINNGSFDHRIDLCPRCGHGLELTPFKVSRDCYAMPTAIWQQD